jgi:hypothetical protein
VLGIWGWGRATHSLDLLLFSLPVENTHTHTKNPLKAIDCDFEVIMFGGLPGCLLCSIIFVC